MIERRKATKVKENDNRDVIHGGKKNKGARAKVFTKFLLDHFGKERLQRVCFFLHFLNLNLFSFVSFCTVLGEILLR